MLKSRTVNVNVVIQSFLTFGCWHVVLNWCVILFLCVCGESETLDIVSRASFLWTQASLFCRTMVQGHSDLSSGNDVAKS
jgi:hypothetical protein